MPLTRVWVLLILVASAASATAQDLKFHFRRPINGPVQSGWAALPLPSDIFQHVRSDLSDLRIYHLAGPDTTEAQYILRNLHDEIKETIVELPVFNKSKKDGKLYVTVELKGDQQVNRLDLDIEENNFNGFAQLEGSTNLREWFQVDTLQRILSIKKDGIDFKATSLNFPLSHYRYLRIELQADQPLTLRQASFKKIEVERGVSTHPASQWTTATDKATKQTILTVTLNDYQPLTRVVIEEEHELDFYRVITIAALRDSTKTPKGWSYYYDPVYAGYITSINAPTYDIPETFAKKLKITIYNADNAPLKFKNVTVAGPQIELVARMEKGENVLLYGNESVGAPSYDVAHFDEKIPKTVEPLTTGPEESLLQPVVKGSPLLESKWWLWVIMGVIIAVLGYFTLKMMKAKG